MSENEWLARYAARFVAVAEVTPELAADMAQAVPFEDLSDMFEDDPEGAADEEMSYWSE